MKTYKYLWDDFISDEHIEQCIVKAAVGKKDRPKIKKTIENPGDYVDEIRDYVLHFHNFDHDIKLIKDGIKVREIMVPKWEEHVIHHMIISILQPMFTRSMYKHTYSSIPGRGMHRCSRKVTAWIRHDKKNTKYCLKMDIRKFFNTIDHDVLKRKFRKYVKDKKLLNIIETVIDVTDKGIPIGFYTSHWFANWLLDELDHYIKEKLHIKYYTRYMDDMILFGSNKRKLHEARRLIERWLNDHGLQLKSNWQVFRMDYIKDEKHHGRVLDFIGFKFYRDRTTLRKSLMKKLKRKAKKIAKKKKFTIHDAHQMMSYLGYVDWSDTYKVYKRYCANHASFTKCRKYISHYDKNKKS